MSSDSINILILDTYYSGFLKKFSQKTSNHSQSHRQKKKTLFKQFFGTADSYSFYLKKLGARAEEFVINDYQSQKQWAKENNLPVTRLYPLEKVSTHPVIRQHFHSPTWIDHIVKMQVRTIKPEVVYLQQLDALSPFTLETLKKSTKLLVGQIASPLPSLKYLKHFDLILSSFPHFINKLKNLGVQSEYFELGFDPRILKHIKLDEKKYDVTFIGSLTPQHRRGTKILESVAAQTPIHIWSQNHNNLDSDSPLHRHFHGPIWGLNMYQVLAQSKIVINRHIEVARNYANNMRLYEATGCGAMLITDQKKNLSDLFKIGKEIETYSSTQELIKKIRYYLAHPQKRQKISKAGQKRTLSQHSYQQRMKELVKILAKYL